MSGNGNWSDASNWNPNTYHPNNGGSGVTYDAVLDNGGTITLDLDVTIQKFTLSAGTLTGGFDLTVNELLAWSGGAMSGAGVTNANGGMLLDNAVTLQQRTLNNAADQTATLGNLTSMSFAHGATFNNNGVVLAQADGELAGFFAGEGGGTFNNAGTFTRNTGESYGTFTVGSGVVFHNTGTVNVEVGILSLEGGDGGSTTGDFNVADTLQFASNFNLAASAELRGSGSVEFNAGTVNILSGGSVPNIYIGGGTANFNADTTAIGLTMTAGVLGGSGTFASTRAISWSGGTMSGAGITNANAGIGISGVVVLDQRTLNNPAGANASMTNLAQMSFAQGATFNNNGNFLAQTSGQSGFLGGSGGGTFNNAGTFRVEGAFSVGSSVVFNNTGSVAVSFGNLRLDGPVTQYTGTALTGGVWSVAVPPRFAGGTSTLRLPGTGTGIATNQADITLSGAGSVLMAAGASLESTLTTNSGALRIRGGRNFTAANALTNSGVLQLSTITGNPASTLTAPSITVTGAGSILSGSGTVNVSTGPVTVDANATLQGGDGTTGTTLTIAGALTMNPNSIIQLTLGPDGAHSTLARSGAETWAFQPNQAFSFLVVGGESPSYTDIITGLNGLSIDPSNWTITNAGWSGQFTFDGSTIDLNLTPVPEPSTWVAAGLAAAFVVWTQRRRLGSRAR